MRPRLVLFGLVITLLAAAIQTAPAQTPSGSAQQISSVRDEWVKDWNMKNLQALIALYAQDAVLLPSAGQRITGRDAIEAYLKQVMDSGASDLSVTSVSTQDSGKLGYNSGSFKYTIRGGGATIGGGGVIGGGASIGGGGARRVEGNYLIVLMRGPDGKWLIVQHASTEVPAGPSK